MTEQEFARVRDAALDEAMQAITQWASDYCDALESAKAHFLGQGWDEEWPEWPKGLAGALNQHGEMQTATAWATRFYRVVRDLKTEKDGQPLEEKP